MEKAAIKKELKHILEEKMEFTFGDLSDSTDLESKGIDSLNRIRLLCFIEEHFDIRMENREVEDSTVADLVHAIYNKINPQLPFIPINTMTA